MIQIIAYTEGKTLENVTKICKCDSGGIKTCFQTYWNILSSDETSKLTGPVYENILYIRKQVYSWVALALFNRSLTF